MPRPQTHRISAAVTVLTVAALTVSGCSGQQASPTAPASTTATPSASQSLDGETGKSPTAAPDEETKTAPPKASATFPGAVATKPVAAPTTEGDTTVHRFGDIEIRLTPNELGVYTAIRIPNLSDRPLSFSISLRVKGLGSYRVLMIRKFPSVLPGDSAREAGLLIDKEQDPVPEHPVPEIVAFEQTNS